MPPLYGCCGAEWGGPHDVRCDDAGTCPRCDGAGVIYVPETDRIGCIVHDRYGNVDYDEFECPDCGPHAAAIRDEVNAAWEADRLAEPA